MASNETLPNGAAADREALVKHAFELTRTGRAREALGCMELAAQSGHPQACIFAAVWRLIGYGAEVEPAKARALLDRAQAVGEPLGLTMRAALAVSDLEGPRDWNAARDDLLAAARRGEHRAMVQLALLLPAGDRDRAALFQSAAAQGNGTARYFHGRALYESGDAATREQGLLWLADVAAKGEPCSRLFLESLGRAPAAASPAAVPPAAEPDWSGVAARLAWPHERTLPAPVREREAPRIASVPGLLHEDECDYLMSRGAPYLQPAFVGGAGGAPVANQVRDNDAMMFSAADTDALVQSIDGLIARALESPPENGERLGLLRYRPGQSYAPHCDWIDPAAPGKKESVARDGQRVATLLVYLNAWFTGGETRFVRLDWSFRGKPGDALLWSNVTPDGAIDPMTLHAGVTPGSGEKWLLSKWMRNRKQSAADRRD